jgi:serine/threonine-protein kinase RsbW
MRHGAARSGRRRRDERLGARGIIPAVTEKGEGTAAGSGRPVTLPSPLLLRLPAAALDDLRLIRDFVGRGARQLGADESCVTDLVQAVDESATNVLVHGYGGAPGPLDIEIGRQGTAVAVAVRDQAPGFDPRTWPEPDLDLPLSRRRPGGFGVHLTRACVDRVEHAVRSPAGNELTLVRRSRSGPEEDPA